VRMCFCMAALAMGLLTPPAYACGACDEDKIAATYDHAVIEQAKREHRAVVFAAIQGDADAGRLEKAAADAARRAHGVDRSSVRSSQSPLALSFSLDGRIAPEKALAEIGRGAARSGAHLALLKVQR